MTYPQQPQQPGPHQQPPGYGYPPQQPTQPYGRQPYPPPQGYAPPPPPKKDRGKIIGFSALAVVALIVIISVISAAVGGGSDDEGGTASDTSNNAPAAPVEEDAGDGAKAEDEPKEEEPKPAADDKAVYKVWGDAPNGVEITYGSDSDSRTGKWAGKFEATLPVNGDDDMYFNVFAQLNGGGDINCSVTIGGDTDKAHASGGYNICDAQLNADFTGGWSG